MDINFFHIRNGNKRREFLKILSGLAVSFPLFSFNHLGINEKSCPKRILGRTGEKVSLLSIGGYHLGNPSIDEDSAIEIMRRGIDQGINFFDNAHGYNQGRSEILMGKALKNGYRRKVILMTKLMARTVEGAKKQMEESLKRFDLDSIDLLQFHHIGAASNDVDSIYNNGLIEWALEQRSQGVFKYIGFTGHSDPAPLIDMIERGFEWDTVMMPLNIGDYHRAMSFQKHVLPLALKKNIGVIGMKSNGFGRLGSSNIATAIEGLRYTMSLPVATVVSGMDTLNILNENLSVFHDFKPYSEHQINELLSRSLGKSDVIEGYYRKI